MLPELMHDKEIVARFTREARAAVQITSEHVARVLDVGKLETGAPYIVMEYLDGGDLAAWLEQRGALALDQAVDFVLQACVALAEAHSLGIVHRDLKPANLFCIRRPDGKLSIKVLDFGISKMTHVGSPHDSGADNTKTSSVMGSPFYMSPEQMRATRDADSLTDIWSLGVILYELVTGKVPFDGTTATNLAIRVATEPPVSPRVLRGDMPEGLEAVILRCLEKDKRRRFPNVAELALALAPYAPRSARQYVDRIRNTIHSAGLSSDLASPPSFQTGSTQPPPPMVPQAAPSGPLPPEPAPVPSNAAGPAITTDPVTESVPAPPMHAGPTRLAPILAGVLAAIILVGAGAMLFARASATTPDALHAAAPSPSATASTPPAPSAQPPLVAAPPPTGAPPPEGSASATPASPGSPATPQRHRRGSPGHLETQGAPATATPATNPAPAKPASPLQMQPL